MKNLVKYISESYEYTHNLSKSEQDWVNYNKGKSKNKVQPKSKKELIKIINDSFEKGVYDLNFIDTSKITDMSWLFENVKHNFDVSDWDVSNVKDMTGMFYCCKNFDCDLSNWDVSNVTDMTSMFGYCNKFDCDLSNWDVSNVTDMYSMFTMCKNFKGKGLENWYVSKAEDMRYMFSGCDKMTIPNWYKLYHKK